MKLTLLTTTAIIALSMTSTAKAEEASWFESMKQSVQAWYTGDQQPSTDVETYLDEVTIAVPPMTGEEAAAIQPAAGDYQESLEEAIENIPGSVQNDDQSFNTEFSNDTGSIAAFEDNVSADDLANIMPAAGDAEEITDEAVVVADEATDELSDTIAEFAEETQDAASETVEAVVERVSPTPMAKSTDLTEQTVTEIVTDKMPTQAEITETATQAATGTRKTTP